MTQSIRDAAQAVLDAGDMIGTVGAHDRADAMRRAVARLRAALSAPQPTADERIAEHMAKVTDIAVVTRHHFGYADKMREAFEAVEQSARALLSASQEDAEHAAMYRWMREQIKDEASRVAAQALLWNHNSRMELDAAIRAAMSSKETK